MVRADPSPPVMVKDHKFTFFLDIFTAKFQCSYHIKENYEINV